MKHFVLDPYDSRVPVVRMFDRFGRLTAEAALADEIEIVHPNGSVIDFEICVEHAIFVLQ